jgi:hypothetical protein
MKHLKLFESFEVVEPIIDGEPLNNREINFLREYNVMCPEWISKDDNYYYVFNYRCENIKDVPETYIHGVCKEFNIKNYTINDDYSIDVKGNVYIYGKSLSKLPFKFNIVSGVFNCGGNKLTNLEGSPKEVGGDFECYINKLTTLEGGPTSVGGYFICHTNQLTSLEGSPKKVGIGFYCSWNKLSTLEGGPEFVGGNFICRNNPLKSREYKGIIKGKLIYREYQKHNYETSKII